MNRTEVILSIVLGVVTLIQSVWAEWMRRRATRQAHEQIADRVVSKINGRSKE